MYVCQYVHETRLIKMMLNPNYFEVVVVVVVVDCMPNEIEVNIAPKHKLLI